MKYLQNSLLQVLIAALGFALVFGSLVTWKYQTLNYNGLDLAIINQVFFTTAQGNYFASSIHPPSYLGDHVTLIIFLFLPLYQLFPSALTLLWLQVIILAACGAVIYLIAKEFIPRQWSALIAFAWLLNPFVHNLATFEYHFLPMAILFILLSVLFYLKKQFIPFVLSTILAVLVREDVAFATIMLGVLAWLDKRHWRWMMGPLLISFCALALSFGISTLASSGENYKFLIYYQWLGSSWFEIFRNALFKPYLILLKLFGLGSWLLLAALLLPVGYLSIYRPRWLLLSALIFVQLMLGAGVSTVGVILKTQYSSLLLPGIFVSLIFSVAAILKKINNGGNQHERKLMFVLFLMVSSIYGLVMLGPLDNFASKIFSNQQDKEAAKKLIQMIPREASIAASYSLITPLSERKNVYSLNYAYLGATQFMAKPFTLPEETEFIAVDFSELLTYQIQYQDERMYNEAYMGGAKRFQELLKDYGLVYLNENYGLYQKGTSSLVNPVTLAAENNHLQPLLATAQATIFQASANATSTTIVWQQHLNPRINLYVAISADINGKKVYETIFPLDYGLLDENAKSAINKSEFFISFQEILPTGNYEITAEFFEPLDGYLTLDGINSNITLVENKNSMGTIRLGTVSVD